MTQIRYKYKLYQHENCTKIQDNPSVYNVQYEEIKWTLNEGGTDWKLIEIPLEIKSKNIDEKFLNLSFGVT